MRPRSRARDSEIAGRAARAQLQVVGDPLAVQVPPQQRLDVPHDVLSGTGTPVSWHAPVLTFVHPMSQGLPGAVTWHCEAEMQQFGPLQPPVPLSQAAWPAGQLPHLFGTPAPSHVSGAVQAVPMTRVPQPPQLLLSLLMSSQIPLQTKMDPVGPHEVPSGLPAGQTHWLFTHEEVQPAPAGAPGQPPQLRALLTPQWSVSVAVPQATPALAHKIASGSEVHPHVIVDPFPPHVVGAEQAPPQALQLLLVPRGVHVPPQQPSPAGQAVHAAPQWLTSVDVFQHPPPHEVKLAMQLYVHVVPLQTGFAFCGVVHGAHTPLQSSFPLGHPQVPFVHVPPPEEHCFPHVPQLVESVPRLVHNSAAPFTQSEAGLVHDGAQFVPLHETDPLVGAVHFVQLGPHALTSFATHCPPQACVVAGHWQDPDWHVVPPAHTAHDAPQCSGSLVASRHVPPQ